MLEFGNFYVKDIVFGEETDIKDGILTINKQEAIAYADPNSTLENVDLEVARPGESIRILPVRAAAQPRLRPDGRAIFPGFLGPRAQAGSGITYVMKGMSVISVGKYGGWMGGMIDMAGPGAEFSHFSKLINLILVADNADHDEELNQHRTNIVYRDACHRLAEYVGLALRNKEPDSWERYALEDVSEKKLPRVALSFHFMTSALTEGMNTIIYGKDISLIPPILLNPLEIIDGAAIGDSNSCADCNVSTYEFQEAPLIKALCEEHGKTLNFVGFIGATRSGSIDAKETNAVLTCSIAQTLHCDAVIVVSPGNGNLDVDFFTSIIKLEDLGIKTVGIITENCGRDGMTQSKTMLDPKGDAIVTGGNVSQVHEFPAMKKNIGDLASLVRDLYPGSWRDHPDYGPSLRSDGSIIIDNHMFQGYGGYLGWSHSTVRDF